MTDFTFLQIITTSSTSLSAAKLRMSLSALAEYLRSNVQTYSGTIGSTIYNGWGRGNEIHESTIQYFRNAYEGQDFNETQLAQAACQDLLNMNVLSGLDRAGNTTFERSQDALFFIHNHEPKNIDNSNSNLEWN